MCVRPKRHEWLTNSSRTVVCFVFVLLLLSAAGGEIFDHCVSEELLPEGQIIRLIRQTLEGVHQLHQSNLVHLDLKVRTHTNHSCAPPQTPPSGLCCRFQFFDWFVSESPSFLFHDG